MPIGIGHPGNASKVAGYVLSKPSLDDLIEIERNLDKVLSVSEELIAGNFASAQKILHTK